MSATRARNRANEVKSEKGVEAKLDKLAEAVAELARAVASVEGDVDDILRKVKSLS